MEVRNWSGIAIQKLVQRSLEWLIEDGGQR